MSALSIMEQLQYEWLTANAAWEKKQSEVNLVMLQYCIGKGRAPTLKSLNNVSALLTEMCEARLQLDHFMRHQLNALLLETEVAADVIESESFIRAAQMAQG